MILPKAETSGVRLACPVIWSESNPRCPACIAGPPASCPAIRISGQLRSTPRLQELRPWRSLPDRWGRFHLLAFFAQCQHINQFHHPMWYQWMCANFRSPSKPVKCFWWSGQVCRHLYFGLGRSDTADPPRLRLQHSPHLVEMPEPPRARSQYVLYLQRVNSAFRGPVR